MGLRTGRSFVATWACLLQLCSLLVLVAAKPQSVDYGTFQEPSARVRPRFRYWIPDASVSLDCVAADIRDVGRIGAGGVEVLGFYTYGNIQIFSPVVPIDWTKYGWGTPAWREVQDTILRTAKSSNLVIDLTIGPNQGAGVPAEYDDDGLQWDLQPFNASIQAGSTFDDILPGWGTGKLVSASIGLVVQTANISGTITETLSETSLQVITDRVDNTTGRLRFEFPTSTANQTYELFTYYLVHTRYREQQTPLLVKPGVPQSPVTSYVQNGSWVVDHFSARGAQTVSDFWRANLLAGNETLDLVRAVGNYIWEDSQEFGANVWWTPNLPNQFQTNRGYSILEYLPLLLNREVQVGRVSDDVSTNPVYITDEADSGANHKTDFQQTLTELNAEYLKGLTSFAHSIGVESSAQVAYNLPLDMLANIPDVDVPELESLGFDNNLDEYRQYTGAANLAGKRVISSELGAAAGEAYQQFTPDILWQIKRSIAGGVNNFILHGSPYRRYYPNTTWPSFVPFDYIFSEMHNRQQPGWDFYNEFLGYIGRLQWVAQSGVTKVDLAIFQKRTSYASVTPSALAGNLERAGYTYEYLSPDNFDLPASAVSGRVLAPTQQSFKALVIPSNETMTLSGLTKVDQFASQGLPIILLDGIPRKIAYLGTASNSALVNSTLQRLLKRPSVLQIQSGDLAQNLQSISIVPRAVIKQDNARTRWYTLWKQSSSTTYLYVFNDAVGVAASDAISSGTLTLDVNGSPSFLDAWTGVETPIKNYQQDKQQLKIPLQLAGNQTAIIAVQKGTSKGDCHVTRTQGDVQVHNPGRRTTILSCDSTETCSVDLSDGRRLSLPSSQRPTISLND